MGFGLVPLLLAPMMLFFAMALGLGAGLASIGAHFSATPADSQWILIHQPMLFICGFGALWAGTAAMAFLACRKVRQLGLAGRWLLLACGIISLYALFFITLVEYPHGPPYSSVVLFFSRPDRLSFADAVIPWAVAAWMHVRERRAAKSLAATTVLP
jgi:hypothetical protein